MKLLPPIALVLLAGCSATSSTTATDPPTSAPAASTKPATPGVAVVELFSSESCSSCPPAEENLARIAKTRDQMHVITVSFHVDYWNHLGWADPFSSHDYTLRQRRYASQNGGSGYTPQLFVNGHSPMVGSNVARSDAAIDQALSHAAPASVELTLGSGSTVAGRYDVTGAPPGAVLNLALLQRTADSAIPSGENAGRTLHQVDIARSLSTVALGDTASGRFSFALPDGLGAGDVHVAAYVQDPDTLDILGAAATP